MPDPRTMSVREFLRGGYKDPPGDTRPIIVVSGDAPAGTWYPGMTAIVVDAKPVRLAARAAAQPETNGHAPAAGSRAKRTAAPRRPAYPDLTKRA